MIGNISNTMHDGATTLAIFSTEYWFDGVAASEAGRSTDLLFTFILWTSIVSFTIVMGFMLYFTVKYRRRPGVPTQRSPSHHTPLELFWSITPLLFMIVMFFWGFQGYIAKIAPPADAEQISITGQKWVWQHKYANGAVSQWQPIAGLHSPSGIEAPVLAVPAGRPVYFRMMSIDVIHSFYIPDFRVKKDVFPNRYTGLTITADEFTQEELDSNETPRLQTDDEFAGTPYREHIVYCAEYCGDDHSEMAAVLRVVPADVYDRLIYKWATQAPEGLCHEVGEFYFKSRGCAGCHSIDGSPMQGPTYKDAWGAQVRSATGETATYDDEYIRRSILYPAEFVHEGYPNVMPSYSGQLSEEAIDTLICFIKSQSEAWRAANPNWEAGGTQDNADGDDNNTDTQNQTDQNQAGQNQAGQAEQISGAI